jgi:hypothetical protein
MAKSEQIVLQGRKATVQAEGDGQKELTVKSFVGEIHRHSVSGATDDPLPPHIRWRIDAGPLTICVLEYPPQIRWMPWVDEANSPEPVGPKASYRPRRLAIPYVVLKVPFLEGRFTGRAELFYRNDLLRNIDDPLYWPNLLNVSPHAYGCLAWICTQHLRQEAHQSGIVGTLDALLTHLWGGGWNRSSEMSEGNSTFSLMEQQGDCDERIRDVDRWERESIENFRFITSVAWKPVGVTVRQLIDRELKHHRVQRDLSKVTELVSLLLKPRRSRSRKRSAAQAMLEQMTEAF